MQKFAGIIGRFEPAASGRFVNRMLHHMMSTCDSCTAFHEGEAPPFVVGTTWRNNHDSVARLTWNQTGEIAVLLLGELYSGHGPDEDDEPRALLHAYEKHSLACLPHLNGWFSGVIIDKPKGRIVLFNDRYGVGRICYHQGTEAFYFASEAKSLLAVLPQTRTLDPLSLGEHLACGAVLQNRTLFKGISLVPPGSAWTFHLGGTVDMSTYFSPRMWEEQPVLTEDEYYARFKEVWTRRLPHYFGGSRPIALSLTGGVDSRMILAWRSCASGRLVSYTFGGKYRECHDVILARRLAALSNTPHSVIPLDGKFLQQFPTLAETAARVSDGTLDASGAVDIFVQGLAREIAPVRVTGTNGGEILRRLVAFGPEPLDRDIFSTDFIRMLETAVKTYRAELDCHRLSFTAFKQVPWYMNSKFVVERTHLTLRMPYVDNEIVALSFRAPPTLAESNGVALRLIADGDRTLATLNTDRGCVSRSRLSAFATRQLQSLTYRAEYAFDYGMPQWLARLDRFIAPLHVERLFLGRHKFNHFRIWYRDELSGYIKDILLDHRSQTRPYLRRNAFRRMIEDHVNGRRNYTREIHKLLSLELAQRQLIEST